jgi:hypothetical protein
MQRTPVYSSGYEGFVTGHFYDGMFYPADEDGDVTIYSSDPIEDAEMKNEIDARKDEVNHPEHYTSGDVECIDAIRAALGEEQYKGFLRGNMLKYWWRCEIKDDPITNMQKCQKYMDWLTAVYEADNG